MTNGKRNIPKSRERIELLNKKIGPFPTLINLQHGKERLFPSPPDLAAMMLKNSKISRKKMDKEGNTPLVKQKNVPRNEKNVLSKQKNVPRNEKERS